MARITEITVNGSRRRIDAEPDRALLGVLRDDLNLTGTKYGCGEEQCGACIVLIDGMRNPACVTSVADTVGKKITTIEGLEQNGRLHPLQEAFLEFGAFQCGYCTPGMIMAGLALLADNPDPNEAEIKTALETNLCRCGTYPRIVAAIRHAAQQMKTQRPDEVPG